MEVEAVLEVVLLLPPEVDGSLAQERLQLHLQQPGEVGVLALPKHLPRVLERQPHHRRALQLKQVALRRVDIHTNYLGGTLQAERQWGTEKGRDAERARSLSHAYANSFMTNHHVGSQGWRLNRVTNGSLDGFICVFLFTTLLADTLFWLRFLLHNFMGAEKTYVNV